MNTSQRVTLLHGWAANHHIFEPLVSKIPYPSFYPDLPGHGLATFNGQFDINGISDQLAIKISEPIHLLGWSLGGQIALALAARHPQKIKTLTLVTSLPQYLANTDFPQGFKNAQLKNMLPFFQKNFSTAMQQFIDLESMVSAKNQDLFRQVLPKLIQYGTPPALSAALNSTINFNGIALLKQVKLPTLLIYGKKDRITPYNIAQSIGQFIPHAHWVLFEKSAHLPFLSEIDLFCDVVFDFWKSYDT